MTTRVSSTATSQGVLGRTSGGGAVNADLSRMAPVFASGDSNQGGNGNAFYSAACGPSGNANVGGFVAAEQAVKGCASGSSDHVIGCGDAGFGDVFHDNVAWSAGNVNM